MSIHWDFINHIFSHKCTNPCLYLNNISHIYHQIKAIFLSLDYYQIFHVHPNHHRHHSQCFQGPYIWSMEAWGMVTVVIGVDMENHYMGEVCEDIGWVR